MHEGVRTNESIETETIISPFLFHNVLTMCFNDIICLCSALWFSVMDAFAVTCMLGKGDMVCKHHWK